MVGSGVKDGNGSLRQLAKGKSNRRSFTPLKDAPFRMTRLNFVARRAHEAPQMKSNRADFELLRRYGSSSWKCGEGRSEDVRFAFWLDGYSRSSMRAFIEMMKQLRSPRKQLCPHPLPKRQEIDWVNHSNLMHIATRLDKAANQTELVPTSY